MKSITRHRLSFVALLFALGIAVSGLTLPVARARFGARLESPSRADAPNDLANRRGETAALVAGTLAGTVYKFTVAAGNELAGARVQACTSTGVCKSAQSDLSGHYSIPTLDEGSYIVTTNPPGGLGLPVQINYITITFGCCIGAAPRDMKGRDVQVAGAQSKRGDRIVRSHHARSESSRRLTLGDVYNFDIVIQPDIAREPNIYWNRESDFSVQEVIGGSARIRITFQDTNPPITFIQFGLPDPNQPNLFRFHFLPFAPHHGSANVEYTTYDPNGNLIATINHGLYIDPSGIVQDTNGQLIAGATVTLYRANDQTQVFEQLPNGDSAMSPSNQNNPDTTDALGTFGWDVLAGLHKVRASKAGCHAPNNVNQAFVETDILPIPPPVTNLVLTLDCSTTADTTPPVITVPSNITAEATSPNGATVTYSATALDSVDGAVPVICTPASGSTFALGHTTVNCTAHDAANNQAFASFDVLVRDTTPPNVTAALVPAGNVNRKNGTFRANFSATDAVGVTRLLGVMEIPNGANGFLVKIEREGGREQRIEIDVRKRVIELEGQNEAAMRALLTQILADGGVRVQPGQQIQLKLRDSRFNDGDDDDPNKFVFTFTNMVLTREKAPTLRLRVTAQDAAGNMGAATAAPQFRP